MRILLIIAITVLFSCQSQQEAKTKNGQKDLKANDSLSVRQKPNSVEIINGIPSTFLDSVSKKTELSIGQIRNHTSIDSVYYTGMFSDVSFTGDTVFNFYKGFKGVIVDYDDRRSCIYKFLLVLNADNKNVISKIVYTDCDRDESADYTTLHYKLINDSIFETTETYMSGKGKTKKTENHKWKISNIGGIDPLR